MSMEKILSTLKWHAYDLRRDLARWLSGRSARPEHVYLCICDHFEPYWKGAGRTTARNRIQRWIREYPRIADKHRDSLGNVLKYSFFYPEEEYRAEDMSALADLCHAGYGEVEIHLHHDNDTADNLRRTLLDYKSRLHEKHGLLSIDRNTGEISYGFIHGNWALDNSRPDGRWCGVNNEISILQETGCYADFTMPSAPSPTQTRKVNSIYWAVDDPMRPKSHDWGMDASAGVENEGLLMVQGPLGLNWRRRKFGLLPRIENSGLTASNPMGSDRVRIWLAKGVHVQGAEEHVFVKLYTHGAQEDTMRMLFEDKGLERLFFHISLATWEQGAKLHFTSAREMANIIAALIDNSRAAPGLMRNWRYQRLSIPTLKAAGE